MKTSDSKYSYKHAFRPQLIFLFVALITFALDQVSKFFMRAASENSLGRYVGGMDGLFKLRPVTNDGAAFSFATGQTILFIVIAIAVIVAITFWVLYKTRPIKEKDSAKANAQYKKNNRTEETGLSTPFIVCAALVVGGALGNLVDRLYFGEVLDFIWLDFFPHDLFSFPIFNLADVAITFGFFIGAIVFIREELGHPQNSSEQDRHQKASQENHNAN